MKNANLVLLKEQLKKIKELGWIKNQRPGNVGGVGNTLEDLLGIEENNLQLPDFGEWELKSQRDSTNALLTLFHMEPKPRTAKIVKNILLKNYGWPHQKAGIKYPLDERSFRQTINVLSYSDRGFRVNIDYKQEKIFVNFNFSKINDRHDKWRMYLAQGIGKGDLHPHPFWTFNDLENKLKKKLSNLMYVHVKTKYENGIEYFKYNQFDAYINPSIEYFLKQVDAGEIYVDFDARTGHNHGTKFRICARSKEHLYQQHIQI